VAVLERRTKLTLSDKDIYVNVVGGIRVDDPAADLAVCMAVASAAAGHKLSDDTVVFGEVGLGGEIRSAQAVDRRVAEAKKMGFKQAIAPRSSKNNNFIKGLKDMRSAFIEYLQK
jgi:DNA repair protein RadA/Sms